MVQYVGPRRGRRVIAAPQPATAGWSRRRTEQAYAGLFPAAPEPAMATPAAPRPWPRLWNRCSRGSADTCTLRVGQKVGQQLMIGGAPVVWITEIYLPPSLLLRPVCARSSRAHGRSAWVPAWGVSLSRKTLLGWKPLRPAPRCALLLMVMNIQPPLSSTRTRRLAAPLTTVQWASTAIIAAEPGAARCSRRRASTRPCRDRTLPVEWSPEHQIGLSVYRQPFATDAQ